MLVALKGDARKGVRQLVRAYEREQDRLQRLEQQHKHLRQFDRAYCHQHSDLIAGVDEAGRGPLAGPVVAAAVILPSDFKLLGLTDSKQIKPAARDVFYNTIIKEALSYHISVIDKDRKSTRLNSSHVA